MGRKNKECENEYKVKKKKLTYIFHDPNNSDDLADYLIKVFAAKNIDKLQKAIIDSKVNNMK